VLVARPAPGGGLSAAQENQMKSIKEIYVRARRVPLASSGEAAYSKTVKSPDDVASLCRKLMEDHDTEIFLVFMLDIKNRVTGYFEAGRGGVGQCPVDPMLVFRAAVVQGAAAIIVAHNHPTGDPTPSADDIALTKRLVSGGELLGVHVLDHLIIGSDDLTESFAEKGLL
jgi:DNA repair protein RadC